MIAVVLSAVALVVALAALGLVVAVARQSAVAVAQIRRHRLGHVNADGVADPGFHPHRRQVKAGPPRATGERRRSPGDGPDEAPGPETPAEPPQADSGGDGPTTASLRRQLPRPGQIGRR